MKKTLLICGALLALAAPAFAGPNEIHLAWGDCQPAGAVNVNNACTSNSGAVVLYGSVIPPVVIAQFLGMASVVDMQTNAPSLDPWWHSEAPTGTCRSGAITEGFSFTTGPFTCVDFFAGGASGGYDYATPSPGVPTPIGGAPNSVRIRGIAAINETNAAQIDPSNEYYMFQIVISKSKSVGTGSCLGCLEKACFVFNSILLAEPAGVGDFTVTNGAGLNSATYNGSQANTGGPVPLCPQSTPNHNSTWGSVKALYR